MAPDVRTSGPPRALFVCVHNAGRSQMAAAFLNVLSEGRAFGESAGTEPGEHVHPEVAEVMREVDIEVGDAVPRLLTMEMLDGADRVVTMGCFVEDACPTAIVDTEDWGLPDPKEQPLAEVRRIRDQIQDRVALLLREMGVAPSAKGHTTSGA
jgi:arsenate reductase